MLRPCGPDDPALERLRFVCEWDGRPVGSVGVELRDHHVGVLSCAVDEPHRGRGLAARAMRGFGITDRIGNAWCAVAVFGVRGM